MYDTILVSLDGSLGAETVLWEVEKLLRVHPAKIILLLAVPETDLGQGAVEKYSARANTDEPVGDDAAILMGVSEAHRAYLRAIATRLEKLGAETVDVIGFRDPVEEIVSEASLWKVDLIAMATAGRSGVDRLLQGSVTEDVLHRVSCPMLIIHMSSRPLPRFGAADPTATSPSEAPATPGA